MKQVAFITSQKQPMLSLSDALVVPLLYQHDITVTTLPWGHKTDWNSFDMIVIRSAWDYPLRYKKFVSWLNMVEHQNSRVWNMVNTLRWNTTKTYFSTMIDDHVSIVPTNIITNNDSIPTSLLPWRTIVVKPAVGAWAFETKIFPENDKKRWTSHVCRLLPRGPVLIQQYMENVCDGEYSLIFFDKKFSHAVLKIPKKGEFRIQKAYGGIIVPIKPPSTAIKTAQFILDNIPEPLLYARVDGLWINGSFTLMEVELCEPELFLDAHSLAPQKFCDAIVLYLSR